MFKSVFLGGRVKCLILVFGMMAVVNSHAQWQATIPSVDGKPMNIAVSVGSRVDINFAIAGGGEATFSAADLPAWLSLDPLSGVARGYPFASGGSPQTFTVTATSAQAPAASLDVMVTVSTPISGDLAVTSFAGLDQESGSVDGLAADARFFNPRSLALDSNGNLYVADFSNHTVRKIAPDGTVSTLAGLAGKSGAADGVGAQARFYNPSGLAIAPDGSVLVADTNNGLIRKISPQGAVTTVAGGHFAPQLFAYAKDGFASEARFLGPQSLAVAPDGSIYVGDRMILRKISPQGYVSTLAGEARSMGSADGVGAVARFSSIAGLAIDPAGNLYIADYHNSNIRKYAPDGVVSTLAGFAGAYGGDDGTGAAARFGRPSGIALGADGHLYVSDEGVYRVRRVSLTGEVTTAAGAQFGTMWRQNGDRFTAEFHSPSGVACAADGVIYIAEAGNHAIRRISAEGTVTTFAGPVSTGSSDGHGAEARFFSPRGVVVDAAGNIFVDDYRNFTIRKITPDGLVSTYAGTPGQAGAEDGPEGVGKLGEDSGFISTHYNGMAVDPAGNLYVADSGNRLIRVISPARVLTTLAGKAGESGINDGVGAEARFIRPSALARHPSGDLYVADGSAIRKVSPAGAVTTFVGSYLEFGYQDGKGGDARFISIQGLAFDPAGNLYATDSGSLTVRKITPAGDVTTVAGRPGNHEVADGLGTEATFRSLAGIAVDASGNLYVAEGARGVVRRITPTGHVSTVAGGAGLGTIDGVGTRVAFREISGIAVDAQGGIYLADPVSNVIRRARAGAPEFIKWPVGRSIFTGETVRLEAQGGGAPPLSYQWFKLGAGGMEALAGATGPQLLFENATNGESGIYSVQISNGIGSIMGNTVALSVGFLPVAPEISTNPVSVVGLPGSPVTLTVAATGGGLSYQWYRGGELLVDGAGRSGSKTNQLLLPALAPGDLGDYWVRVSNAAGTVASRQATVSYPEPRWPVPALFDVDAYLNSHDDLRKTLGTTLRLAELAWWHYLSFGLPAGWTDGDFDVVAYLDRYPDLRTQFGADIAAAANHWYAVGRPQGLRIPAGFDVQAYLARNPENAMRFANDLYGAWLYYRDVGIYDGEVYDDLFRPEEYLALYPELLAALGPDLKKALLHWLAEGRIEGRLGRIPLEFDVAGYFERNPDVAAAMGGNAILGWQHFWNYGIYEGRAYDDEFRAFEYLALNEDLQAAFLNDWRGATLHWLRYGRIEGRLGRVPPIFDVNFYLTQYPDVAAVWGTYQSTVFLHYYGFGVYEARIFDNEFRVDDYIALNPDLQAVFGTDRRGAFMHWVRWGRSEGRPARLP